MPGPNVVPGFPNLQPNMPSGTSPAPTNSIAQRAGQSVVLGCGSGMGCGGMTLKDVAPASGLPQWAMILGGMTLLLGIVWIVNLTAGKR